MENLQVIPISSIRMCGNAYDLKIGGRFGNVCQMELDCSASAVTRTKDDWLLEGSILLYAGHLQVLQDIAGNSSSIANKAIRYRLTVFLSRFNMVINNLGFLGLTSTVKMLINPVHAAIFNESLSFQTQSNKK